VGPHEETDLGRSLRTSDRPDDSKAMPLRTTSFTSAEADGVEYDRLGNTWVLESNPGRIYLFVGL